MKFYELYKKTVSYFPSEIDISDGRSAGEQEGFTSERLWATYEIADKMAKNDCEILMAWAIYKVLHWDARVHSSNATGVAILRPHIEIDVAQLEKAFLSDLHAEGWEEVLKEYHDDAQ